MKPDEGVARQLRAPDTVFPFLIFQPLVALAIAHQHQLDPAFLRLETDRQTGRPKSELPENIHIRLYPSLLPPRGNGCISFAESLADFLDVNDGLCPI